MDTGVGARANPSSYQYEQVLFNGSATEYFGIWIVNVLLTIITVGVYSAWAKVRRTRYFYGNTVLLGKSFEYHAQGMQIFIGRLIVVGFLIFANILPWLSPPLSFVPSLIVVIALPWLVMRSLRFNARVTSYNNVRFDFVGRPGGAFVAVVLGSVVAFLSLGILAPFASRWLGRYVFNNLRYGGRPFSTAPRLAALYGAWLLPMLIFALGAAIVIGIYVAVYVSLADARASGEFSKEAATMLSVGGAMLTLTFMLVLALARLLYRAGVRNVVWSSTVFDGRHQLLSDLYRFRYLWIVVSNVAVTIVTLGLMRPWAAIREARYVASRTFVRFEGDIGEFLTSTAVMGAAVSAEFTDMEGFDFGF